MRSGRYRPRPNLLRWARDGLAPSAVRLLFPRYFSARPSSVPDYDDGEGLKLEVPLAQSASVCGVAENRSQHCHCRSHAILADTVGITLKGQLMRRVLYRSPRD